MTVLILTNPFDITADDVILRLTEHGVPVVCLDPADFPQQVVLHSEIGDNGWTGTLTTPHRMPRGASGAERAPNPDHQRP